MNANFNWDTIINHFYNVKIYSSLTINDISENKVVNVLDKLKQFDDFSKKFYEQEKYIKTLENNIKELENKVEELTLRLDYLPGGYLMQQAKEHFDDLTKK